MEEKCNLYSPEQAVNVLPSNTNSQYASKQVPYPHLPVPLLSQAVCRKALPAWPGPVDYPLALWVMIFSEELRSETQTLLY